MCSSDLPVALGMCKQIELDTAVAKAVKKMGGSEVMSDDERMKLVSTEQSLHMPDEPRVPSNMSGLENFTLSTTEKEEPKLDADSLFKTPAPKKDEEKK